MAACAVVLGTLAAMAAPVGAAVATVTLTPPAVDGDNGWYRARPTIAIAASEPSSGIASLTYGFAAPLTTVTYTSPYPASASASAQPAAPGTSTLSASAVSGTNETGSASLVVNWDPDAPSQPGTPTWYSTTTGLQESVSAGDEQVCARWGSSTDAASGVRDYHVQVSESPDFASTLVDRFTGSSAANACFGSADGIHYGHAYYARVAGRDIAGNASGFSGPSSRVAVTDQTTGPAVAHAPVTTAFVGKDIPINVTTTCSGDTTRCSARLFYRATQVNGQVVGGSAQAPAVSTAPVNVLAGGWTRVDLAPGATTTLDGHSALSWSGAIPGSAVSSTGVDYFIEGEDTFAVTQYPGATFVGTTDTPGIEPVAPGFFHVDSVSPPLPVHTPPPYGQDGQDLRITTQSTCSTSSCRAFLYYHTTDGAVTADTLIAVPAWPRVEMARTAGSTSLGDAGQLIGFEATVPAAYVKTAGVDYAFSITDGTTTTWSPGTTYTGYYAPMDGMRTGYHHVHVLETPHVAHTPPPNGTYRQPVAISATSSCSSACSATLYFRTADSSGAFASAPMTVTADPTAAGVVHVDGAIPASVVDTRGVDYFFSVTDGSTTTWWPGTSSVDGYVPVPGTRVLYQHVHVLEPPHLVHAPAPAAPAFTDLALDVTATCATEACSLSLHYATSPLAADTAFKTVPMALVGTETPTPLGRQGTYRGLIPAADVTTAGLAYWFDAFDGYTRTYSPGTTDSAAYAEVPGRRAGAYVVHVLEPPHLVHAPVLTSYFAQPISIEARSNCVASCTATLHWRTSGHAWQAAAMTAGKETDGAVVGDVWHYASVIPASYVTTEGVDYWIEATDGYATDATATFHTTVLAPTAVLHVPTVTSFPGRPLPIEAVVPCSTATCAVTLSYRIPGGGLLGEPAWTTVNMAPAAEPTAVGSATSVARYTATIPADAVTVRGVDYFIHATDGYTNAYSPGTAYAGTSLVQADGQGLHYFHVHVAEPVHVVHVPVVAAQWNQPLTITAQVNCSTRNCSGALDYRATPGLTSVNGLNSYIGGQPPFTEVAMSQRLVQDAADAGTVLEFSATIPAGAVTTDGLDYSFHVTDGSTTAYYPGTSWVGGVGGVDGVGVAWQHVEVPFRAPVRAIAHAPVIASPVRQSIAIQFAAYCTADSACTPTLWFRTTPNPGTNVDLSQVLLAEPNWPTAQVRELAVRPGPTGLVLHVFQGDIPADAVDSRGVDYVLKVADANGAMYFPGLPYQSTASVASFPIVSQHVQTIAAPVIHHTPTPAAAAGTAVTLTWQFVCSASLVSDCRTAAYFRHLDTVSADTSALNVGPAVAIGPTPPPFTDLATTTTLVAQAGTQFVIQATATIPAASSGYEQYYLWASDGHTNTYSPGTSYVGGPLPVDGVRLGDVVPWTVRRY